MFGGVRDSEWTHVLVEGGERASAAPYLPEARRFYRPGRLGAEVRMQERLKKLWKRFSEEDEKDSGKQ